MLEILDLKVSFGPIKALDGVSLRVDRGEIAALLGANGSGKTTALRAVTGLAAVQEGRILFHGREIQGLPPHEIIRRGMAVVPEGRRIFANLTVAENLLLGAYFRREKDATRDMKEIFKTFPRLAERRGQRAGTLSGGEQQMLALGRALMSRPRLLLLDEPSLGLAPLLVREVFHIIKRLHEQGVTVLLVEQNAAAALEIAHYGFVLETGRVVLEGKGRELLEHPRLKDAYLGE
ncbi:MAG: ABC transporter ATP-binding protein [Deltaproteobacteria bacterium]|nr:ABC transporter ATP-binding protein [Deltaproteobacteria bacterium]